MIILWGVIFTIANASGTGNHAMWGGYQEKGMAAVGQFDLKIFFRILNGKPALSWPSDGIIRDLYCMDWNVEVNQQTLVNYIKSIERKLEHEGKWKTFNG